MGLRDRFLTAGVAIPLALWLIVKDAQVCLSLVLVLQAICVQELSDLLRRTRAARAIAATGVGVGLLGSSFLLHVIAGTTCVVTALSGRNASGAALPLGMALLVARRLALMRDHWAASKSIARPISSGSLPAGAQVMPSTHDTTKTPSSPGGRHHGGAATVTLGNAQAPFGVSATGFCSDKGGAVMEAGVFLLALEVSGVLWVIGGWSSLVALRFRGPAGAADVVSLLAIVFNSDNGGLFAGSVFKIIRGRQQSNRRPSPVQRHRQQDRKSAADAVPAAAATAAAAASTGDSGPSLLAVASPNKTWVGVAGAVVLGTATAFALEGSHFRLFLGLFGHGQTTDELPGEPIVGSAPAKYVRWGRLCATGVAICIVGVMGDLWESLLKRMAMVKDSGTIFPGHGGCLDRLDGVLSAAPLYLAIVRMCTIAGWE